MTTTRLDCFLRERGFVDSRETAQRRIRAGDVSVDGRTALKPGERVDASAVVALSGSGCPYVSRGGLKLEKALDAFGLDPTNRVALDIGASTGGFTDCLLQRGARFVYALDVGSGQLAPKLRGDCRVGVLENRNIRDAAPTWFDPPPNMATIDVAFISLTLVLPVVSRLLSDASDVVALVKPQFEAGRGDVPKSGVVAKPATHRRVLSDVSRAAANCGLTPTALAFSPIRGRSGNVEFLMWLRRGLAPMLPGWDDLCGRAVDEARATFLRHERNDAHG